MEKPEEYHVLIADDDPLLCETLVSYFVKIGYTVFVAHDGTEALEQVKQRNPDVVVADLRMPGLSGLEVLAKSRELGYATPFIITTGSPDLQTAVAALNSGAFDYLIKPFTLEMLNQKVCKALESVRLLRENASLTELVSLHEITNVLTKTHDLQELLDILFKYCLQVSKSDSGSIQLIDKETEELVIVRHKGIKPGIMRSSMHDTVDSQISKWVIRFGRPLLLSPDSELPDPLLTLKRDTLVSAISVPLSISGEVIGVVCLNRERGSGQFSRMDLSVIEVLASQAGISINNANIYDSIHQKLDELVVLSRYSEQLMGLVDTKKIILCLFETIQKYFSIDFMGFLTIQKRTYEFLYWSRVPVPVEQVRSICQSTINVYNREAHVSIPVKRVSLQPCGTQSVSITPAVPQTMAFTRITPLVAEEFNSGVLYLGALKPPKNESEEFLLLSSLFNQTRIALTNAKLYNDMKENYIRTIKALAIAVDAKDTYTHGHSENVMNITDELCRVMEVSEKWMGIIRDAGLLHDIGKIGIPGNILNKPGALTYDEFNNVMKTHSSLGANIVKEVPFLQDLYLLILYHHESYDGSGYPEGLKGEEIPLGARIIRVADAYEAMTSNRPYRTSLGIPEAIRRLIEGSGKQFDPQVIDAFMEVAKKKQWVDQSGAVIDKPQEQLSAQA